MYSGRTLNIKFCFTIKLGLVPKNVAFVPSDEIFHSRLALTIHCYNNNNIDASEVPKKNRMRYIYKLINHIYGV